MTGGKGPIEVLHTPRGVSYTVEVWHGGLGFRQTLKGPTPSILDQNAHMKLRIWEAQWERQQLRDQMLIQRQRQQSAREQKAAYLEDRRADAQERTRAALADQEELRTLLTAVLSFPVRLDWEGMKDRTPFSDATPILRPMPIPPTMAPLAPPISRTAPQYIVKLTWLDRISPTRRQQKEAEAAVRFRQDVQRQDETNRQIAAANDELKRRYDEIVTQLKRTHAEDVAGWTAESHAYMLQQQEQHAAIEAERRRCEGEPDGLAIYFTYVLLNSELPECFPKEFDIEYMMETRTLVVKYWLPAPSDLPSLLEVKYVAARDDFTEKQLSETQRAKIYNDVLYQTVFRCLHELFDSDIRGHLDAVAFNGHVRSIDKATGKEVNPCILSILVKSSEFAELHLMTIDPKVCFKKLRGVGSSSLHSMAAVAPILALRRDDARFVDGYTVAPYLDEGSNLASMGWEDFEHLIREIFEKEFSSAGGEVMITQASRDGGVDAVAFDPDPIRGGKIVIQAKRYTNTVSVAAVRDLYGTVMNEGALKGILVTTSDFGPDSYEFAANKPLTLMNGSHLLYLLEKHGHKARINISEARSAARQV